MKKMTSPFVATLCFGIVLLWAAPAGAQFRYPMGRYPGGVYDYRMRPDELTSALRLQITPRQAEVYVDGYLAGTADDFDGVFQRLHLRPGEHDIVFYLDGFHSVLQHLYLNPLADQKIKLSLEPLKAGETAEPRPLPQNPPTTGRPYERPAEPVRPSEPEPARFGTLTLRIVPVNADVFIDGEHWRNPNAMLPLSIQLSPGRHKIKVTKDNYETYSTEIEILSGETNAINVSLKHAG